MAISLHIFRHYNIDNILVCLVFWTIKIQHIRLIVNFIIFVVKYLSIQIYFNTLIFYFRQVKNIIQILNLNSLERILGMHLFIAKISLTIIEGLLYSWIQNYQILLLKKIYLERLNSLRFHVLVWKTIFTFKIWRINNTPWFY